MMGTTRNAPSENAPSGADIADGGLGSCFNVALPSIQHDLGFSPISSRSAWATTVTPRH